MVDTPCLKYKVTLLEEAALNRALMRLSYEIVERADVLEDVLLVGILTRGVPLSRMIADNIEKNSGVRVPTGALDITLYRDDLQKVAESPRVGPVELPFDLDGKEVVLVDDVLYTGRTARAAIDALFSVGRPAKIRLAVLVDRGHRELPIRPDYVGKNVPTSQAEVIRVNLKEVDGRTNVEIWEFAPEE